MPLVLSPLEYISLRKKYTEERDERKTVPTSIRPATTCASGHVCHIQHKRPARCFLFALTQTVDGKRVKLITNCLFRFVVYILHNKKNIYLRRTILQIDKV